MDHPLLAAICGAMALAVVIRMMSSPQTWPSSRPIRIMMLAGLALLSLAAGTPFLHRNQPTKLVVLIDLSPSTRGATYRVPNLLAQRLAQLTGNIAYRPVFFSDHNVTPENDQRFTDKFPEMPSRKTIFTPEPADAIVAFTDARFDPPATLPPTFVIVDPALENPVDAAITDLSISPGPGSARHLIATIHNSGPPRKLTWRGTADAPNTAKIVPTGDSQFTSGPLTGALTGEVASAQLNPDDAWPENDAMSIRLPPAQATQRWWVSDTTPAPPGWQSMPTKNLPQDAAAYLGTAVVALDDVSADSLPPAAITALDQFVRQLGGGLLILGGPHAFAAGGYSQTPLESLSPLASVPPQPRTRWIILVDASGSMAQQTAGRSSWQWATDAATHLLSTVPPNDSVYLGSFAQDLKWWANPAPAKDLAAQPPSPPDGFPTGPTNLQAAIAATVSLPPADIAQSTQLILITDAQASIDDLPTLAHHLAAAHIRVNLLAIAPLKEPNAVAELVTVTNGSVLQPGDVTQWSTAASQLAQAAQPPGYVSQRIAVRFLSPLPALAPQTAPGFNAVWPQQDAQLIAQIPSPTTEPTPIGAVRHTGIGRVAALGTIAQEPAIQALTDLIAAPPRDPRLTASLQRDASPDGNKIIAKLDAADPKSGALTDLNAHLDLIASGKVVATQHLTQTAPGIYQATLDNDAGATLALLTTGTQLLGRLPLPTGYAPEFSAVGNDHSTMDLLASRSGGRVIAPTDNTPIILPHVSTETPLTQPALILGVSFLGLALLTIHGSRL